MKSAFESQILGEVGSVAKTSIFKLQTVKEDYTYKITIFLNTENNR